MFIRYLFFGVLLLISSSWGYLFLQNHQIQLSQKKDSLERKLQKIQFDLDSHDTKLDYILSRQTLSISLKKNRSALVPIKTKDILYIYQNTTSENQ